MLQSLNSPASKSLNHMLNFKQELRSQAFKPFVCDLFLAFWRAEGMQCCQSKADKEAKPKWQTEVVGNICLTLNLCIGWKGFGCFLELGRESSWFFIPAFHMGFSQLTAPKPQVLLLSTCTVTACSTQASGLLCEKTGTDGQSARLL